MKIFLFFFWKAIEIAGSAQKNRVCRVSGNNTGICLFVFCLFVCLFALFCFVLFCYVLFCFLFFCFLLLFFCLFFCFFRPYHVLYVK